MTGLALSRIAALSSAPPPPLLAGLSRGKENESTRPYWRSLVQGRNAARRAAREEQGGRKRKRKKAKKRMRVFVSSPLSLSFSSVFAVHTTRHKSGVATKQKMSQRTRIPIFFWLLEKRKEEKRPRRRVGGGGVPVLSLRPCSLCVRCQSSPSFPLRHAAQGAAPAAHCAPRLSARRRAGRSPQREDVRGRNLMPR